MNKKLILVIVLILLAVGGLYLKKQAECFAGTGAVDLPQVNEVARNAPIVLPFKMLRIAAPGCLSGHTSESYKNVSCGFKLNNSDTWTKGKLIVTGDSEMQFEVECHIPPLAADTPTTSRLDYYFEYSAWGKPAERKTSTASIK